MIQKTVSISIILLISVSTPAQNQYEKVRDLYYQSKDTLQITGYIQKNIKTAKKEKNFYELFISYRDAIPYSENKIRYADSALYAAKKTQDATTIGSAYLTKGITLYYYFKKYQEALDEYLKAYDFLKESGDDYLRYKNRYHIAVVKNYLGYYDEALPLFQECGVYFKKQINGSNANSNYNHKKGYINALQKSVKCYVSLGNYAKAESVLKEAYNVLSNEIGFENEKKYLDVCSGITSFHQQRYKTSEKLLSDALTGFRNSKDIAEMITIHYYRGKAFEKLKQPIAAKQSYLKIDSLFNRYHFLTPEARPAYEQMIRYSKNQHDNELQLYFTRQLLKADSLFSRDFRHLSTRIHKDYDTKSLLETKGKLEKYNTWMIRALSASVILFLLFAFYKYKNQQKIRKKYQALIDKLNTPKAPEPDKEPIKQNKIDDSIKTKIIGQLELFEEKNKFLEKGLTLSKMADRFGTNTSYLSHIINDYKGGNFNMYINTLRVNYATQLIYKGEWRSFSIENIAKECGFSNRQSFSNLFYEINGIRPTDFISRLGEKN